jgi:hypothetical protein
MQQELFQEMRPGVTVKNSFWEGHAFKVAEKLKSRLDLAGATLSVCA